MLRGESLEIKVYDKVLRVISIQNLFALGMCICFVGKLLFFKRKYESKLQNSMCLFHTEMLLSPNG